VQGSGECLLVSVVSDTQGSRGCACLFHPDGVALVLIATASRVFCFIGTVHLCL
jgi:hypothetical protein